MITALEMRRYGVTANAISPIAATRMTADLALAPGQSASDFDPRDPANASGVLVYLASDAASWLTGQVLRIDGNRVQRLQGWTAVGEYASRSGGALEPGGTRRRARRGVRHDAQRPRRRGAAVRPAAMRSSR